MSNKSNSTKCLLLTALALTVYFLHQDCWNWKKIEPLVFGFLPIGLAYHAAYSIVAAVVMAIFVKFAWPKHLEEVENLPPESADTLTRSRPAGPASPINGRGEDTSQ